MNKLITTILMLLILSSCASHDCFYDERQFEYERVIIAKDAELDELMYKALDEIQARNEHIRYLTNELDSCSPPVLINNP